MGKRIFAGAWDYLLGRRSRRSHVVARRIWLQDKPLRKSAFSRGDRFRLRMDPDARVVEIIRDPEGDRRVSGKTVRDQDIPVIDISNAQVAEVLGETTERIRVEAYRGYIRITVHPSEAAAQEREERLFARERTGRTLRIGDLAHGGGILLDALATGLVQRGIKPELSFAVEVDEPTLDVSMDCNPWWTDRSIAFGVSMAEIPLEQIPKVEMLIAGLPCVGASRSGKSKNQIRHAEEHPKAGELFVHFLKIIERANPMVVLLENVPDYRNTVSMIVIRNVLSRLGYDIHETIVDNRLGAFEQRRRMCMVAVNKGYEFNFDLLRPSRKPERTLGEMLEPIPEDAPCWSPMAGMFAKEARDRAAGKMFRTNICAAESESIGTIGAGYAKNRGTEPKVAHPTRPGLYRLLTPVEHARVKSIPERLIATASSNTLAHHILGNSVLHAAFVSVGHLIGESVERWKKQFSDSLGQAFRLAS